MFIFLCKCWLFHKEEQGLTNTFMVFFFFLVQKRENLNFRKLENQNINKDNVKFLNKFFLLLEINVIFSN